LNQIIKFLFHRKRFYMSSPSKTICSQQHCSALVKYRCINILVIAGQSGGTNAADHVARLLCDKCS